MIKVETAIANLLFEHDCVVIPLFGGLLANNVGAEIHPITNALKPPHKKIAFNEGLVLNDGLLQNFLVVNEGVKHEEALTMLTDYVTAVNKEIRENEVYHLVGAGSFIRNEENKIQFQPSDEVNFLDESFGLSELYYKPIQREPNETMEQTRPTQNTQVRRPSAQNVKKTKKVKEEKEKSNKVFVIIPAVLVMLGLSIFLFTKKGNGYMQQAGLLPDTTETVGTSASETTTAIVAGAESALENGTEKAINSLSETTEGVSEEFGDVSEEITDGVANDVASASNTQFYIIAGVFSTEENARNYTTLYHKGEVIHDGEYYRVSLDKFPTKEVAKANIEELRANFGENLWILEHI